MYKTYQDSMPTTTAFQHEREYMSTPRSTVLLLAPHESAEDSLAALLAEAGYDVDVVESQAQALETLSDVARMPQVILINTQFFSIDDEWCETLRNAAANPVRLVALADDPFIERGENIDAVIAQPWHDRNLLTHIQSQVRVQQQLNALVDSRSVLLSTSVLAMERVQNLHGELDMQTALRQELLQRVHTHIGALRDYMELEVRRLPLGIAREAMRGVLYRVRSLSALYDSMAILGLDDPIDFCKLATKIGQGVKAIYSPRSKLPLTVEGELLLSQDTASPLTLVVNELVTNAYRHAFPGGRFGKITISCGSGEGFCWCRIEDNGVGMPNLPEKATNQAGGTTLIQRLLFSSLGGTCSWESNAGGTTATVRFPLAAP